MSMRQIVALCAVSIMLSVATFSRASVTIVDNTWRDPYQPAPVRKVWWNAQAFTTDNSYYQLDSVAIRAGDRTGPLSNIVAHLWSTDAAGTPVSVLCDFNIPDIPFANGVYPIVSVPTCSFTPKTRVILEPEQTYAFSLEVLPAPTPAEDTEVWWMYLSSRTQTGAGSIGARSSISTPPNAWLNIDASYPSTLGVFGTVVPEPGITGLLVTSSVLLLRRRHIRGRKRFV